MRCVSIVVPIHNEEENIPLLYAELTQVAPSWQGDYELIFVDDGSTDAGLSRLREIAAGDARVKVIVFRRNFGQTAAMKAGLDEASGDVIVTLDGDLQNDPRDIAAMLDKIEEGYDLVHGWRRDRKDALLSRRLPSRMANRLISKVTRFPIRDLGCTLKAMRAEVAGELELYGEMHRFIPILAHSRGARCFEMEVNHRARQFGRTKYGIGRTFRVLLDLMTVKFMLDYFASPMKLFGKIGLLCAGLSMCALSATIGMKLWGGVDMTGNPLLLLAVFLALVCFQFFSLGLLGEVNARIYFRAGEKRDPHAVRERINFDTAEPLKLHRAA